MMNTVKTMNDEALTLITGGNYGDSRWEALCWIPTYSAQTVVEVYTNFMHLFTKRGTIIYLEFVKTGKPYRYLVEFEDGSRKWVEADDIQYDPNEAIN